MTIKRPATLVGLAIGDALGMPFEKFDDAVDPRLATWDGWYVEGRWKHRVTNMLGTNVLMPYLPPGCWTDDTEMALALAESMLGHGYYDAKDAAMAYLAWARSTPTGMGTATRDALRRLDAGMSWEESGTRFEKPETVGNGTAMRIAPLGVYYRTHGSLAHAVTMDARITHAHDEAVAAAFVVATLVATQSTVDESLDGVLAGLIKVHTESDPMHIRGTDVLGWLCGVQNMFRKGTGAKEAFNGLGRRGNAAQTVSTAVYCALLHQNDFHAGVQEAVRGGGDTDTRAAITGAILGARLGLDAIPKALIAGLKDSERLIEVDEALFRGPVSAR